MPLTTRAALFCMWLPPMDSQESFRYVQWQIQGVWGGLVIQILVSRTTFGQTLPQLSFFFSQAVFKSGIQVDLEARDFEGELVMARADVAGRLGGQGGCSDASPSLCTFYRPHAAAHGRAGPQRCYAPT